MFAADRAGFGMNTTPELLLALLTEATATVTSAADDALAESAGDDKDPPTQNDLATWFGAGNCPPEVLAEVAKRLAVLWGLDPGKVRVTGWAFGGLVMWRDGLEFHAPAAELLATAKKRNMPNPLAPLVKACPVPGKANLRPDRILTARLAMVDPADRRAGRLFSPAAHRRGQLVMPGFELADHEGPALPLALYQLGQDNPQRGGGRGAALALRLFVEAILAAPYDQRQAGQPVALQVTLRDLLDRLYPGQRRPKPNEYWPRLMRAVEALDTMDARIPWQDPQHRARRAPARSEHGRHPARAWRTGRRGAHGGRPAARLGARADGDPDARSVGRAVRSGLPRAAESGLPVVRPRRDPPSCGRPPLAPDAGPGAIPRAVRCRRGGDHAAAVGSGRTSQPGGRGLGDPTGARRRGRAPHRWPPGAAARTGCRVTFSRAQRGVQPCTLARSA